MSFYYISLFSWIVFAIYFAIAAAIIFKVCGAYKLSRYWKAGLLTVAFIVPWTEELWIAYNFGQLCRKDAGLFISKTVDVEGFYDDTTHWWRQLKENSNYQFVESRDNLYGTFWRAERDGNEVRHFKIEKPTARYRYIFPNNHSPVSYRITKIEYQVIDSQIGKTMARQTKYARQAYWFFIGLDAPLMLCPAPGERPHEEQGGSLYNVVLIPVNAK